jgi:hypothetical protein
MGRKTAEMHVYASISNHNDEQDDLDEAAWKKFAAEVRKLAQQPEYADINIDVNDHGAY